MRTCIDGLRPDAIVNLAAWNAVDAAESDPEGAMAVNGTAVRHLANASRRFGAHLTHVSSDYVFDGTKDGPISSGTEVAADARAEDSFHPSSAGGRRSSAPRLGRSLVTAPSSSSRSSHHCLLRSRGRR